MPSRRGLRVVLAALLPLIAFAVQAGFWGALKPFSWFLFYPAVFVASWIGGRRAGLLATVLAIALVWVFFIPPQGVLVKESPKYYLSAAIFAGMGILFSEFHEALRRANVEIVRLYQKTKEIDELKSRLYARVSHELRTPLALVLGSTERWLATPETPPEIRRDLDVAARNARTLLRHVNDLLDVAKLEARAMAADWSETDVASVLRRVTSQFEVLSEHNDVALVVEAPPSLSAQVDPEKLQRIISNLVSNAFKFTPHGGRVRATLRERGECFSLEVADSGPGIPEARRDEIFEPFRQLDDGVTRRFGGTGLGLAIVRELVTLHRGTVRVGVAKEGGALIVVEIPRRAPPDSTVRPAHAPLSAVAELRQAVDELTERPAPVLSGPSFGTTILVIEDNLEMNRFVAETLAAMERCRVVSAFDGEEGLARATELLPDLIVSDVMMPRLGGDALLAEIRKRPELDATPIVMLTARTDEELRVRLLQSGADDYLIKPFSIEELRARVGNLIARKRSEEQSRTLAEQISKVAEASTAVSEAIAGLPSGSVEAVLHTIVLKARTLTSAKYGAVGIGTDPERSFEPWVSVGVREHDAAAIGRPPRPVGLLGLVARGDEAVRLADLRAHPAFRGLPPHHPEMTSLLAVPIRYRGRAVGNLYLADKVDAPEFTEQDQRIVEMLAARVGSAIETARLYHEEGMERAWLQSVVDQMPEGVVLLDATGRVTTRNRAADALGDDFVTSDGQPIAPHALPAARVLQEGEPIHAVEMLARRPDGVRVPVLVSAAPVRDPRGEITGATVILRDISSIKEIERLREEWAAIIAHDLQNPVNAIVLTTDVLLRRLPDDTMRDPLRRIRTSAQGLSRMIRDLTDAAALESQRLELKSGPVELVALMRDLLARLPDGDERVVLNAPAAVEISGDRLRLEQVFANLVSNALKYGESGAPVEVAIERDAASVSVAVTNRGAGIPADEIPHLFERYVRARAAREGGVPGSGLGLYIAHGLILAHGGRIEVESRPGDTTTFRVRLPASA